MATIRKLLRKWQTQAKTQYLEKNQKSLFKIF